MELAGRLLCPRHRQANWPTAQLKAPLSSGESGDCAAPTVLLGQRRGGPLLAWL